MRDLGTLAGGTESVAHGINATGQVVGEADAGDGQQHAFITGPSGMGMRDLGSLWTPGEFTFGWADGINDAGQVVGISGAVAAASDPFITGPNGTDMRDLGNLGGSFSEATAINDAGQVVGWSNSATTGDPHAFITGPDGMGMRDLGNLGDYYSDWSVADGINDAGQVVGYSEIVGGAQHAFITGPDGANMMDLNSLISLPAGVTLTEAVAINNMGQVIAVATGTPVIPEPETYALLLAGLGLVGFMARWRKVACAGLIKPLLQAT